MSTQSLLELGRAGTRIEHVAIIDMHAHIHISSFGVSESGPEGLVEAMDRTGVAVTIITASAPVSERDAEKANEEVLQAVKDFPGRLRGYFRVWPTDESVTYTEAEHEIEQGFLGVKLYNNVQPYDHASYAPYLAVANEQRRPVLFHTWGQEADLNAIRAIAQKHPEASLLAGHAGSANEEAYVKLAQDCANVYLDLTLSASPRGLIKRLVDQVGADRVVWGSDAALFSQAQQLGKVFGAKISEEDKVKILSGNARRILERVLP